MKGKELLESYPLSAEVMREWFIQKMTGSLKIKTVPEDFKEYMRQNAVSDTNLANIIDFNPRAVFDVLDNTGIYVDIVIDVTDGRSDPLFGYHLLPRDIDVDDDPFWYSFRKEAEGAAIEDAFKFLEKELAKPINA